MNKKLYDLLEDIYLEYQKPTNLEKSLSNNFINFLKLFSKVWNTSLKYFDFKEEGILKEIIGNHKVHQLLHQTFDIAKSFHEFYEKERVVGSEKAGQKLAIIEKFKQAYEAIFAIIGVDLLNKM